MMGPNENSRSGSFFTEKSGAGLGFLAVLLVILLTLVLLVTFPVYSVASAFEKGELQDTVKVFLQDDNTREQITDTLRDTLPEEVISDEQIDTLLNDDTILKAVGQFAYDLLQSEAPDKVSLAGQISETLDDPANASLYGKALDRLAEVLKIDDETYREAIEAIAEDRNIRLPEDKSDKLALLSAVVGSVYEEMLDEEQASEAPPAATPEPDNDGIKVLASVRTYLAMMQTPYFVLYNLLTVAVVYGLLLLLKRSYRKPFLHCMIPYAIAGVFLLALRMLVRPIVNMVAGDIPFVEALAQSAESALTRGMLVAFLFALPMLAAYITLTVIRRRNLNRPGGEQHYEPQNAGAAPNAQYDAYNAPVN